MGCNASSSICLPHGRVERTSCSAACSGTNLCSPAAPVIMVAARNGSAADGPGRVASAKRRTGELCTSGDGANKCAISTDVEPAAAWTCGCDSPCSAGTVANFCFQPTVWAERWRFRLKRMRLTHGSENDAEVSAAASKPWQPGLAELPGEGNEERVWRLVGRFPREAPDQWPWARWLTHLGLRSSSTCIASHCFANRIDTQARFTAKSASSARQA